MFAPCTCSSAREIASPRPREAPVTMMTGAIVVYTTRRVKKSQSQELTAPFAMMSLLRIMSGRAVVMGGTEQSKGQGRSSEHGGQRLKGSRAEASEPIICARRAKSCLA